MKEIVRLTEEDLHRIISEAVSGILCQFLYHKAPVSVRKSIMKNGLVPSVGDSYRLHWEGEEGLVPYVFLYSHEEIKGGEYDSTYDDDIYAIDVSKLDMDYLDKDPDEYMTGCYAYRKIIPPSAIKLVYKGSKKDSGDLSKHKSIYQF